MESFERALYQVTIFVFVDAGSELDHKGLVRRTSHQSKKTKRIAGSHPFAGSCRSSSWYCDCLLLLPRPSSLSLRSPLTHKISDYFSLMALAEKVCALSTA